HEADQSRKERRLQRIQIRDTVDLVRQQVLIVRKGDRELQMAVGRVREDVRERRHPWCRLGQADLESKRKRDEKEDGQEQERRKDDEPATRTLRRSHDSPLTGICGLFCAIHCVPCTTFERLSMWRARLKAPTIPRRLPRNVPRASDSDNA